MKIPKLYHHKGSQQGTAKIAGRNRYFGKWPREEKTPPPEVQRAYEEFIGRWIRRRQQEQLGERPVTSDDPFVRELWAAFLEHATAYYRKDGKVTSELSNFLAVGRLLDAKFGDVPLDEFKPSHLEKLQAAMIEKGWVRESINKQVGRIRQIFKWGVRKEIVDPMALFALKAVEPLKKGRTLAKESKKPKPVTWDVVLETVRDMTEPFPDMVRVHWLIACRSQDVVRMRPCDLVQTPAGLEYHVASHKVEHHGVALEYAIGPEAKAIIERRAKGLSPQDPIFPTCRRRGGKLSPYSSHSYNRALQRHIEAHNRPHWIPRRLRRGRLTEIASQFGIEDTRAVTNHKNIRTTDIYLERDRAKAHQIMNEIG